MPENQIMRRNGRPLSELQTFCVNGRRGDSGVAGPGRWGPVMNHFLCSLLFSCPLLCPLSLAQLLLRHLASRHRPLQHWRLHILWWMLMCSSLLKTVVVSRRDKSSLSSYETASATGRRGRDGSRSLAAPRTPPTLCRTTQHIFSGSS